MRWVAVFVLCASAAAAHAQWVVRPGVYGRIEVKGPTHPPLIYDKPVVASLTNAPKDAKPVYLYVPPGQVRKWDHFCIKWQACETPVYFVRVDDSPSRLGRWKHLREQHAGWEPSTLP